MFWAGLGALTLFLLSGIDAFSIHATAQLGLLHHLALNCA
jgi:hypothetical protein